MPWLLAVRRKKLLHQHLLLKHLLLHLQLLKLLLLRLPLLLLTPLLLLLLTPPSRLTLLLLLTLLSQLTLLRQNNHQIIFKKPVSGPVFFRPQFCPCISPITIGRSGGAQRSLLSFNRTALTHFYGQDTLLPHQP